MISGLFVGWDSGDFAAMHSPPACLAPRRVRRGLLVLPKLLAAALLCLAAASATASPIQGGDGLAMRDGGALGNCLRPQGYEALPLRRGVGPHLEVVARINGVPGRFLVDTGAQITVVNAPSLEKFHLTAVKTGVRVYGAVGGPGERIRAALASRLQIGPCEASPFLLGVSDLTALNQGRRPIKDGQFDGIIGADVLQSFSFVIDCTGLRLYAKAPEPGNNNIPQPVLSGFLRERGYSEIEMHRFSISDFELLANVNGRKALWLVDTGAAITLLDTAISREAGIKLNHTQFTVGGAGGGRRRIDIGVVDNLRLASLRVHSAVIAISDISANNAALQEQGKPPIDGYLGADFLREKGAVIDCAQMQLYLKN
jgi:predicted aspartyl protease